MGAPGAPDVSEGEGRSEGRTRTLGGDREEGNGHRRAWPGRGDVGREPGAKTQASPGSSRRRWPNYVAAFACASQGVRRVPSRHRLCPSCRDTRLPYSTRSSPIRTGVRAQDGSRVFAVLLYCACYSSPARDRLVRSDQAGDRHQSAARSGRGRLHVALNFLCRAGAALLNHRRVLLRFCLSERRFGCGSDVVVATDHPQSADQRSLDYNSPDFGFTKELFDVDSSDSAVSRAAFWRSGGDDDGPNLPTIGWKRVSIVAVIGKCFKPLKKFVLRVPAAGPVGGGTRRRSIHG
jgi:hypothetical protein